MATLRLKHNPSHMPEDELIRDFVVRQRDLAAILETVRENTEASNQHLLILGPRGMGKTTLVNRAVAEICRDALLRQAWYPILFDEESYTVTSAGELWYQALLHLADQTQSRELEQALRALKGITGDRLRDAALARLLEFADAQGKRLLLVFENIDMIFDEQLTDDDAWDVRHTLQNEPRIMALATSTTRLESFHDSEKPLYELFREHTLERLDLEECRTVWRLVTGVELPLNQARPIQIFTGGNTRLVTILGTFAKDRSFRELMDDLVGLIDENTPYFKANVERLPKESRKIFVTLADLWSPATARQVADQMRGDIRAVSAQLGRLEQQGIVEVARRVDKTAMYQVTERMYNLYRLLRSRGSARVRAVVEFIVQYYGLEGMPRFLASLASEACDLSLDRREDLVRAYCELMRRIPDHEQRNAAINDAPVQFREIPDIARLLQELAPVPAEEGALDEAELRARLERTPDDVPSLVRLGRVLTARAEVDQAFQILDLALTFDNASGEVVDAMIVALYESSVATLNARVEYLRGVVVRTRGLAIARAYPALALCLAVTGAREEAREMANEALERWPNDAIVGLMVGKVFAALGERRGCCDVFMHVMAADPSNVDAVRSLSHLLIQDGKTDEAEEHLRRCLSLQPRAPDVWIALIDLLRNTKQDLQSALRETKKATVLNPDSLQIALRLGTLLMSAGQQSEAEQVFRRIVVDLRSEKGVWGLVVALIAQGKLLEARKEVLPRLDTSEDVDFHLAAVMLFNVEGDVERCRSHLRRALKLGPQSRDAHWIAVKLLLEAGDVNEAREVAEHFIAVHPIRTEALLSLSSFVLDGAIVPLYSNVIAWAHELADDNQTATAASLLLARALARTNAWEQVWRPLGVVLANETLVQQQLRDVIELVSLAAAAGHAGRASSLLAASASAARMEPLLVALRRMTGEASNPPQEVSEVADDIVRDIERMREALERNRVERLGTEHRKQRRTKKRSRSVGEA